MPFFKAGSNTVYGNLYNIFAVPGIGSGEADTDSTTHTVEKRCPVNKYLDTGFRRYGVPTCNYITENPSCGFEF
jgi:hypothetical protein